MSTRTVLITGGEGFIGHNLARALIGKCHLILVDNYITGTKRTFDNDGQVTVIEYDICRPEFVETIKTKFDKIDEIYHLASLASPPKYTMHPIETLDVGYIGTKAVLELCVHYRSKLLYTSTSEVYGDPERHPQKETYYGNVNPFGPRSNYDESKRIGETLVYTYIQLHGVDGRIARVFNTYGEFMDIWDGRIVTEIIRALRDDTPLTIYGSGKQTRSMCYIKDTVDQLVRLMNLETRPATPVNVGNDSEISVIDLVDKVTSLYVAKNKRLDIVFKHPQSDDPKLRRPCLLNNTTLLGPTEYTPLETGLKNTIKYFVSNN